jgi:hypothetical protein
MSRRREAGFADRTAAAKTSQGLFGTPREALGAEFIMKRAVGAY